MDDNYIPLRFIGKDGSMGLKKDYRYFVKIYTHRGYIVVNWDRGLCPYSSLETLCENWESV